MQWALRESAALDTIRGRINFADGWNVAAQQHVFGTPNEINFLALSQLAADAQCSIADLWQDWAADRYGNDAAGAVIPALQRSVDIVRKTMFFHGATLAQHSEVPSLAFLTGRIRHSSWSATEARGDCVEENAILMQLANDPTTWVLWEWTRQIDDAARLCQDAIAEVEAARKDLAAASYQALAAQFTFTAEYIAVFRLIAEAYVRLRMKPERRPAGNGEALAHILAQLRKHAAYAQAHYGADCILQAGKIRLFASEVEDEAKETHG